MVRGTAVRSGRLVGAIGRLCLCWLFGIGSDPVRADGPVEPVRSALGRGSYPWYDSQADSVVWSKVPEASRTDSRPTNNLPRGRNRSWSWSDYLVFAGFATALMVLVGLIVRYWRRFEPQADFLADAPQAGVQTRLGEVLPAGLRNQAATDDPWSEANRRQLAGDFAGAVVCLFAHQLICLSRLGLVRLAPGRTGRQLHRSVTDPEFQALLAPTLRQFEAVFYGHRPPSAREFAILWSSAQDFERRIGEQQEAR